jgi:peptide/nickel transport system ATP-binding protein
MYAEAIQREPASEPILEVRNLTKHFQVGGSRFPWGKKILLHAADDVSFALYPGKVVALVGESGSGKSTIARLLARVYPPTSGQILFHGKDVAQEKSRAGKKQYKAQVQMIFQDPFGSLNPVKRIEHHLERPLIVHKIVPRDQVHDRVLQLLETVGLVPAEEIAHRYPHELSGGQRQRVNIARALAVEPDVLLADEPISMLDVSIRLGVLNVMLDLKEKSDIAFLYITHDIASARYVADEIIVMYAGQIVEKGPTDAVLHTPLHPYTRELVASVPDPEGGITKHRVEARGEAHAAIDPKDQCRFVSRCPVAVEASRCITPQLVEVQPDHWVRCHLYPQPEIRRIG